MNNIKRDFGVIFVCLSILCISLQLALANDMVDPFKRLRKQTVAKGAAALKAGVRTKPQILLTPSFENQRLPFEKTSGRNTHNSIGVNSVFAKGNMSALSKFQSIISNLTAKVGLGMQRMFGLKPVSTGIDKRIKDVKDSDVFEVFRKGQKK